MCFRRRRHVRIFWWLLASRCTSMHYEQHCGRPLGIAGLSFLTDWARSVWTDNGPSCFVLFVQEESKLAYVLKNEVKYYNCGFFSETKYFSSLQFDRAAMTCESHLTTAERQQKKEILRISGSCKLHCLPFKLEYNWTIYDFYSC
jgi:hypothetical protein